MSDTSDAADDFDSDGVIVAFRTLHRMREAETTAKGKALFDPVLMELRKRWPKWNRADLDELPEIAVGDG